MTKRKYHRKTTAEKLELLKAEIAKLDFKMQKVTCKENRIAVNRAGLLSRIRSWFLK